ncbi:MAG: prenyltransferase [Bacteroidales bacterium]|jgi:1,4-dihydroxy-2-naphthoate octaprenyltransferase|nr:prenyltransferase [Bacteroidales bacterium]MDD3160358.1 prenyltransferase [Bacteroidales bacterium]
MSHSVKNWVLLTRPWSFPASAMPAIVAISYLFFKQSEFTGINWYYGLLALLGAVIFQASGNSISDYFDFKNNVDTKESLGTNRLLVDGVFPPKVALQFGFMLLTAGSLLGLFLLLHSGWDLLWIGIIGVLGAAFYCEMKYRALGDLLIFIIYGPLIGLGTAYVMTGTLIWTVVLITIPIAFLVVNILHANNTRDIRDDRKANIKTQAILLGEKGSKIQYLVLGLGAYIGIALLVAFGLYHPLTLSVFITLPITLKNIKQMQTAQIDKPERIDNLDEHSAKLVMAFGIILSLSNFAAAWL